MKKMLCAAISILVFGMTFSFGSLPTATAQEEQHSFRYHMIAGTMLKMRERYAEALVELEQAAELKPDHADLQKMLADLYVKTGDLEKALAAIDRAIALDPETPMYHFKKGQILDALNRPEESIAAYEQSVQVDPNFKYWHNDIAYPLLKLGRYDEALEHVLTAIEEIGERSYIYDTLGDVYLRMGENKRALDAYRTSAELDPNKLAAWRGVCIAANRLGRFDESIAAYEKTIDPLMIRRDTAAQDIEDPDLEACFQASLEGRIYVPPAEEGTVVEENNNSSSGFGNPSDW